MMKKRTKKIILIVAIVVAVVILGILAYIGGLVYHIKSTQNYCSSYAKEIAKSSPTRDWTYSTTYYQCEKDKGVDRF